ncbi:GGDEF domain-containing protein [Arcobacter porcinus]|uniref:diguanylate cyclase n=1 Tax=Arcobacter porcinus TaxID=1935204 RepID=A0A5C2HFA1_9BACT|nr:GGDEF domain-containing protein [Arcobacter porcinus]OCL84830.1 putative diguanylate cyclase AdrA [Arcobacter porcinus]OCL97396.1 putative diguanylate cyclase AdrA [Aliarcobacter thereius]QEP41596.1 diguanylate cyclase [Arcobacter porcinus]
MDKVSKMIFTKGISLKNTIFLFSLCIIIILLVVMGSQLLFYNKELALSKVASKLKSITIDLKNNIEQKDITYSSTVKVLSFLENDANVLEIYSKLLKSNPSVYAIYTLSKDNKFIQVINLDIHKDLGNYFKAKQNDKWLKLEDVNNSLNSIQFTFYDENLNETSKRTSFNDYSAEKRPWYENALKNDEVSKTYPYEFLNAKAIGITYSKKSYDNKSIVSLDLLVHNYLDTLKTHIDLNSMELFLLEPSKRVLSYLSKDPKIFQEILNNDLVLDDYKRAKVIENNGKKYILRIINLDNYNNGYLALLGDYNKITEPYNKEALWLLSVFLFVNILTIPIILYLSRMIVRPIYSLVEQSNKIKSKDFNIVHIDSNINEINLLSNSFTSMSKSIYEHQTSLEEKILQRTEELHLKNIELEKLSITDKLTSLYNRAKLDTALKQEFDRAKRYNEVFSLILIDLDFFKSVNDTYGHQIGDDVLRESAQVFKSCIRETDILGRWGGEEFLIICPNSSSENAMVIAEKLNESIKKYNFTTYPKPITISLGISSFNHNISKAEDLLSFADIALYEAKKKGRDKAIIYNSIK